MSENVDSLLAYLELLHANRHLIAAAYCNRGIALARENERKVHQLQQHRVLLPYYEDDYRLSPSLSRHFDEIFQRQRSYAAAANFGDLFNRLPQLINEYVRASHEGRFEDQEMYAAEFDHGVFDLASLVRNELMDLRIITENQFANVKTLAEKQRQNKFYLDRAEKIGDVLSLLQGEILLSQLEGSSLLRPLFTVYQRQILSPLQAWRATHLDITAVLKAFLYRLRQVEPQARRLRALAHYLRKHPDYQPPEADEVQHLPDWASRIKGLRLKAHPDLSSAQILDALVDIASAIPAAKVTIVRERAAGSLCVDSTEPVVRLIQPKPVQAAFHRYVEAAARSPEPLSALAWKRLQPECVMLADDAWLLYLMHALGTSRTRNQTLAALQSRRLEAPAGHPLSGNIVVTDIILWKKD